MEKDARETKLVKAAARGNPKAYGKLINTYKDYFYRMAYLYTKNEQDALDALQISIIKGYNSLKTLKNAQLFTSWMNRIIINSAKDIVSKSSKTIPLEEDIEAVSETGTNTDEKIDVLKALDSLPEKYRMPIILMYYKGLRTAEISEQLNIPENTVSTYIYRGRQLMKKSLGENYMEERV